MAKLIIFSAPSGSGKSTIINHLLEQNLNFEFSISATSRLPRGEEVHGKEYYFLTSEEFKRRIGKDDFLEYEEVYEGRYYGTLKEEVDRIMNKGANVILDLDVLGGCNVKKYYGDKALSVFIKPPSIKDLRSRLEARQTETDEQIAMRIARAEKELSFASQFDVVIINDDLEQAKEETVNVISRFLNE